MIVAHLSILLPIINLFLLRGQVREGGFLIQGWGGAREGRYGVRWMCPRYSAAYKLKEIQKKHKVIKVERIDTKLQIADILTKSSLFTAAHKKHTDRMLGGTYAGPHARTT